MKILVIDDAADIRLFVSAVLEGAGHQALTAADSMKAISLLSVAEVDALVLDVMMPRFSGFELVEILRRDPRTRRLPILLLSSLSDTKERIRDMRLGATDFLPKPVDPDELVVRIARMTSHLEVSPGGVAGELDENGLMPVLQDLEQAKKSGTLSLTSEARQGWIELSEGEVATARYGLLEGAEALLAMLGLEGARFWFEPSLPAEAPPGSGAETLDVHGVASQAARLEGELSRCRGELPDDGAGLFAVRELVPATRPRNDLPLEEIYERIETLPGITLAELVVHQFLSEIKVRLAVAELARTAVIRAVAEGADGATG